MNAIQEIKDENVRKVAQTLRTSGLASSETEAVRMAIMMTKTSQKISQNFDEKNSHINPFQPQAHPVEKQVMPHTDVYFSVRKSSSVQEKPMKTEEKEEFIFGDVQEKESVQKKDVYKIDNDFEEVVVQEVIITKEMPLKELVKEEKVQAVESKPSTFKGWPSMFGSGTIASQAKVSTPSQVHQEIPRPVQMHQEVPRPVQHTPEIHVSSQMPTQKPALNPSPTPVSASGSAQMAFASLLGDVKKTQEKHQEQKPAVQPSPAQASYSSNQLEHKIEATQSSVQSSQNAFSILLGSAQKNPHYEEEVKHGEIEAQKVVAAVEAPKVQPQPTVQPHINVARPDPRANMMKGVDVDLTKMFNVNK